MFNLFRLYRKNEISFYVVSKNGNNIKATFDFVEATFDFVENIVRLVAFDDVASILLLVWTALLPLRHLYCTSSGVSFFGRLRNVENRQGGGLQLLAHTGQQDDAVRRNHSYGDGRER